MESLAEALHTAILEFAENFENLVQKLVLGNTGSSVVLLRLFTSFLRSISNDFTFESKRRTMKPPNELVAPAVP